MPDQIQQQHRSHNLSWLAVLLTLGILGGAVAVMTLHLRGVIRQQIVQQDGEILHAATVLQQDESLSTSLDEDPADYLLSVLQSTRLRDVLGVRLFGANGEFLAAFPDEMSETRVPPADLELLRSGTTVSRFRAGSEVGQVFPKAALNTAKAPLLHAFIPLKTSDGFIGAAEFILNGKNVSTAYTALDRDLLRHALLVFILGGAVAATALGWAMRKLQNTAALLAERTEHLLRANHELSLAAKASAVGAVTAHLIHGLKNPLFGLQTFVSSRSAGAEPTDTDWQDAVATTRRMQTLINDVVHILQEEEKPTTDYEISIEELIQLTRSKVFQQARDHNVRLLIECAVDGRWPRREANLVALILTNLVQNALEATLENGTVTLRAFQTEHDVLFQVADTGPGLPPHAVKSLFTPSHSSKTGGTGIGLAISKQLANHLGADLKLEKNSEKGAVFQLRISRTTLSQKNRTVTDREPAQVLC